MNQLSNYDLEERTAKFGEGVLGFCRTITETTITKPLISQIVRSSTSIGANYMEANGASSKTDFRNKIFICRKEVQETKHWLRMLKSCLTNTDIGPLWQECHELNLIFQKITSSLKIKN